jgi:hypothetical protein
MLFKGTACIMSKYNNLVFRMGRLHVFPKILDLTENRQHFLFTLMVHTWKTSFFITLLLIAATTQQTFFQFLSNFYELKNCQIKIFVKYIYQRLSSDRCHPPTGHHKSQFSRNKKRICTLWAWSIDPFIVAMEEHVFGL